MKSRTLWLTMFCLALLTVIAIIGGAKLPARAKQTPVTPSSERGQANPKKAPPFIRDIDPKILAAMRRQEELQPAVQALYEASLKTPDSGFTGVAFENDGVSLYWKGELNSDMVAALTVAREVGPVEIKPAPFSLAEMEAEAAKIDNDMKALGRSDIQAIVTRYDGSGLDIERMPYNVAENLALSRANAGQTPLRSAEQVLAGLDLRMPVRVITADEPIELMADRFNDSPPWNSGGYFESRRNGQLRGRCTTGFGIRSNNRTWVMTAAHCATPPDIAYQGLDRQLMGPVTRQFYQYDLILIDAPGFYRMFDNPQPPYGYPWKNVYGWGYHVANELLCQSGASSGVVCGLKTGSSQNISVSCSTPDSDGDCGYTIYGVIKTTQINGQTAGRIGDSGGPVFSLMGDGVRAKGSVTGGSGSTLFFQDWADVIRLYNGYPVTP
jgi:hypothetical protein